MNKKLALTSAAFAACSLSYGEIVINDFLSFEGFIDMSYVHADGSAEADVDGVGNVFDEDFSDNSFAVDQVEISWLFDFDKVTAQIDLEYEEAGDDLEVEEAFATYHFDGGSAITAGRFASMLGFEAFEPTGLYQYSTAYSLPFAGSELLDLGLGFLPDDLGGEDIAALTGTIFPIGANYSQGVKYTYESDEFFFGASLLDGDKNYDSRLGGSESVDGGGWGAELAGAWNVTEDFTWFVGLAYEDGDGLSGDAIDTGDTTSYTFNTYVTYEMGAWFFAAEFFYGNNEWDDTTDAPGVSGVLADIETDSLGGLIMANWAYSEKASVTGRISYVDYEIEGDVSTPISADADIEADMLKFTLAHNYAFTDNLLLVLEVSYAEGDGDLGADAGGVLTGGGDAEYDELIGAVELIFSF